MKKVKIFFDPVEHKYTDEENNIYTSATTLIGMFEPEFKTLYWAVYRALDQQNVRVRPNKDLTKILVYNPKSPLEPWEPYSVDDLYNGSLLNNGLVDMVKSDWKQLCDAGCDWGNIKHDYLEDCVNEFYEGSVSDRDGGTVPDIPKYDERTSSFRYKILNAKQLSESPLSVSHPSIYKLLVDLVNKGFVLYAEKRIYSYKHRISGTIDLLAVRGKDFYIIDWKTNKGEIHFEPGYYKKVWNKDRTLKVKTKEWVSKDARFKTPISHITHCKGHVYTLQLSLYAYLCELWGFNCLGLTLCHIRHKESVKVHYVNNKREGLDINKRELKPRIYNITYRKDDVATLCEWHKAVKVNNQPPPSLNGRGPIHQNN